MIDKTQPWKLAAIAVFVFMAVLLGFRVFTSHAAVADDIAQKNRQIEEIQRQIDEYQRQIDENRSKASTLQGQINKLNAQIGQINLQIRSLGVSIDQTELEIQDTQQHIVTTEEKLAKHRGALGEYLRLAYETDQTTLTEILLNHATLSDFFNELNNVQATQDNLRVIISDMKVLREDLETRKEDLEGKQEDLEHLKTLQEIEKQNLNSDQNQKNKILKDTKGQEAKYQQLVQKSVKDIENIRQQIGYLLQTGISAEDAVKYAQLAALGAGIRPAFLLALLEIESRLGKNVGTGNWNDDMYQCYLRLAEIAKTPDRKQMYLKRAEIEKSAFFSIITKLGLDPNTVKVSREPSYGCGGAMGPAQFIPSTWLGYEAEVSRLTGHSPVSPWNFQDAFTASAIKLARGGATSQDRAGESAAARAYISGNSKCVTATCNSYVSAIQRKAEQIEQDL